MKRYKKPEFHFVRNAGGLNGIETAGLSDAELEDYLSGEVFAEEKKKYRIKSGFILREIAGEYTIVPVDSESLISNALMAPNDSAVFLWKAFQEPSTKEDVVRKGLREYETTEEVIRNSIDHFVESTLKYKILEEVE